MDLPEHKPQATGTAWNEIEAEFGLLTGGEVARLLGVRLEGHDAAQLISVHRGDALLYPGFQFDLDEGKTLPVMAGLLEVAGKYGKTQEGLTHWLCSRTGQLINERPVDHLHEPERVLEAAENHYGVEW
ncbi:hypothetical protein ASH00_09005 [Arthrobacter sp. Soil782]|uniref:hypothetical protein n=1 Tax=Arthrobacter sp. Soil782 TaxID=1736410 RepID=UPI0006FC3DDF|nr:hypothetical protein [Arthrobacter sp. Soil782]KRF05595.1 hypothetical protein ASH00_09005 [Arthrobacter sp. Soil782]